MIPSALSGQLEQGLKDFLRFSFWSSTPGMERVIDDLIDRPDDLIKGPYVTVHLPFRRGQEKEFFPQIPLGFVPHLHQERAFRRLTGRRKRSTLVATGTGSGKTESFLLPILDHCREHAGERGVKAVLIYPMNALATDQALRIARLIHGHESLRGKVRAGLYIGDDGTGAKPHHEMGPEHLITARDTMQDEPPDILLTNYKMLDYLLLRPQDQGVWRHNHELTLQYLVVDELHTFDGAQGTDLACLIRRLKRRVGADQTRLCCVGTSATLGGEDAGDALTDFAASVFGERFDAESVIGESRLTHEEYLGGLAPRDDDEPSMPLTHDDATRDDREALDPAAATDPEAWLRAQVALWFGEVHPGDGDAWAIALGERLRAHRTFHALLKALGGQTRDVGQLVADMARSRTAWRHDPTFGVAALRSLLALVSAARTGTPGHTRPFLDVRVQLWQRELRRMVGSLVHPDHPEGHADADRPQLTYAIDLDADARSKHLPMLHCRDCGAMGWVTLIHRDKPDVYASNLDHLYRAFFSDDPQVRYLYPAAARPVQDPRWPTPPVRLDLSTMRVLGPDVEGQGRVVELAYPVNTTRRRDETVLSRDCPFCGASGALSVVGFRAATLTSVYIDQLYASPFNDDKKLLAFSDSVQDAAHRAGFFGARTWRTNLRIAIADAVHGHPGLTLKQLATTLGDHWRGRMSDAEWVTTFLPPDLAWTHEWDAVQRGEPIPEDGTLQRWIPERLAFEVYTEFGMQAGIGRSLLRTQALSVGVDLDRLDTAITHLVPRLENEVPGLRGVAPVKVRRFVLGLLRYLRRQGAILDGGLPERYVKSGGKEVFAFKTNHALPSFTRTSRLPLLLADRPTPRFLTWGAKSAGGWLNRWVQRGLPADVLGADPVSVYPIVIASLVYAGVLQPTEGKRGEQLWGIHEAALRVYPGAEVLTCATCGHRITVAPHAIEDWHGAPCQTARCDGRYEAHAARTGDYFARLYAHGHLQRIIPDEHTGLLTRQEREAVERRFKAANERAPWDPNLLSCTPTLEMGIDIGDLSSAILCSVPPAQANFLQRIGRAGRRDGNALVLTIANGRPHDLYFWSEPREMLAGAVEPPGIFLNAPAVLERQLTAFCFDRWVAGTPNTGLPRTLHTVFKQLKLNDPSRFPFSLLGYVERHEERLLREFEELFEPPLSAETRAHLRRHLIGDDDRGSLRYTMLDAFHAEQKQRETHVRRAAAASRQLKAHDAIEARADNHDDVRARLDEEKAALEALVRSIDKTHTLELLTGRGLLPNYAFPESAVSLKSIVWRKKPKPPARGSHYDTLTFEYRRSPSSALSELAPEADFYASGRRVQVDQIDLNTAEVESWRICPSCTHMQRDTVDVDSGCPACGAVGWIDQGQRFRLLKLQQVYARTAERRARIRDDRDERQPRFFQREMMVQVSGDTRAAWHVDDERFPFGFEFVPSATFREVNFGTPHEETAVSVIAGETASRPGFHVCAQCGKVQRRGQEPEHDLTCPSRRKGAEARYEEQLYLYREFRSEALQLLLPMLDTSRRRQLRSFVAALQLGLKARFRGSVDHLRTTEYTAPVEGIGPRKQYLVVYDTVPGGTGYLKQLVLTPSERAVAPGLPHVLAPSDGAPGDRLPLYEVFELAKARIDACSCDDGCYRCIYAYRNASDRDNTSAKVASELLAALLAREDRLAPIPRLSDVEVSGLMDSTLEERFPPALAALSVRARVRREIVRGKPGFRWTDGERAWLIEPQVQTTQQETLGVATSVDFVLHDADPRSERKIAVFLDGFAFHKKQTGHDLRQRIALQQTSKYEVWSLTWHDLDEVRSPKRADERGPDLLMDDVRALDALQDQLVKMLPSRPVVEVGRMRLPTVRWLERDLDARYAWEALGELVVMRHLQHRDGQLSPADWADAVDRIVPPAHRDEAHVWGPVQVARVVDAPAYVEVVVARRVTQVAGQPALEFAVLLSLDDDPAHQDDPAFRASWAAVWRLFQVVQGLDLVWFTTPTELARDVPWGRAPQIRDTHEWDELEEVDEPYLELAHALIAAGIREPAIGYSIPTEANEVWADGELVWEDLRIAVMSRDGETSRQPLAKGWQVYYLEDLSDPATLITLLNERASR